MHAASLHPELVDYPMFWVVVAAFVVVFIAAVIAVGVWVTRRLRRRGRKP